MRIPMKRLLTLLTLVCLTCAAHAQEVYNASGKRTSQRGRQTSQGFDPNKIIFGGGLALGFGNNSLVLGASPIIGYRITDRFSAGVGVGYLYARINEEVVLYDPTIPGPRAYPYKSSLFYPSVWTRFLITQNIFLHAEFEYDFQSARYYDYDSDPTSPTVNHPILIKDNIQTQALLLGGGFRQPITTNTSLTGVLLYDVLQQKYSPYKNRVDFRLGVSVGF